METPEKIYVHKSQMWGLLANEHNITKNGIEYIRKDVFIEKVKEFLWAHTPGTDYHVNYIVKKFEKYMEE